MKRIAVVTGASSGIGREFALRIAAEFEIGELWLVARRRDRLQDIAREIEPRCTVRILEADLGTAAGCALIAALLESEAVVVEIFVNSAGFGTYGPFLETDREWQLQMVDLNVRAVTHLSWAALRHMDYGSILINVASLAAFMPLGKFAVYAATKAYVLSLTAALSAEVKEKGIKVTALCPGPVDTEFALVASGGARQKVQNGLSPGAVVRKCLRDARGGKLLSILALGWKLNAFGSRFMGRRFIANLTWRFYKRPQAKSVQ